jgi:hypothetical protein
MSAGRKEQGLPSQQRGGKERRENGEERLRLRAARDVPVFGRPWPRQPARRPETQALQAAELTTPRHRTFLLS